ncbi:type II toxin-antitoxin system VapC family toxin [Pseudarthrobacter sp. J64]|uniref:type II toxin-antitoxin system VapC family toxin n=1 Tax=Pseudarthrobacter sp. J64 TaxID=3116485 RepID=UPI002E80C6EB|nr:type II toxin-antitoxin system VapC family toxin [Pseudarthrobacter sp. J64]MEE2570697.1 type II toxin-antitoxin system VapC family toxin [Pseudarthrobacter sp. J64]
MIVFVDTSAVLKLMVEEQESTETAEYLQTMASNGHQVVGSMLLYTELHCAGHRRGIPSELVTAVLHGINLVDLIRSDLMYAAALPGKLRSTDAIHLATAIRVQADEFVAYDAELLEAAVEAGLTVQSPGKTR